jgi:hypothetical protein
MYKVIATILFLLALAGTYFLLSNRDGGFNLFGGSSQSESQSYDRYKNF